MNKFILAAAMLWALCDPRLVAHANGATTILFSVAPSHYVLTAASLDADFQSSPLNSVFHDQNENLLIARVDHKIYRTASYINDKGYDVVLGFDEYQDVRFSYYPAVQAFLGFTAENDLVVLQEMTPSAAKRKPNPELEKDCPDPKFEIIPSL